MTARRAGQLAGPTRRWARLLGSLFVPAGVGLIPYLGKVRVPLFPQLLALFPQSIANVAIIFSTVTMSIVAAYVEFHSSATMPPKDIDVKFRAAIRYCIVLLALLLVTYFRTVTLVPYDGGAGTASFVTGFTGSRDPRCAQISRAQCIALVTHFNEANIDFVFGERQVQLAKALLVVFYVGFTSTFAYMVALIVLKKGHRGSQSRLSGGTAANQESRAKSFVEVLNAELDEISKTRARNPTPPSIREVSAAIPDPTGHPDKVFIRAHGAKLIGLAFSGGGIRSATFNLGILQGLAELSLLKCFDYLSTVSGGGYIGGWLEAWIKRRQGIDRVEDGLQPSRRERKLTDSDLANKESREIRFLREYSNYLTPRLGLLGADTWTGVALYLGNVFLNQAILILSLSALLLLPRLATGLLDSKPLAGNCGLALAVGLLTVAAAVIVYQGQGITDLAGQIKLPQRVAGQAFVVWTEVLLILLPLCLLAARYANGYLLHQEQLGEVPGRPRDWAMWGAIGYCSVWLLGWFFAEVIAGFASLPAKSGRAPGRVLVRALLRAFHTPIAGAVLGLLLYCVACILNQVLQNSTSRIWHLAIWGLPLTVAAILLATVVHAGLLGLLVPGTRREWWGRAAAWLLILSGSWAGIGVLAIYSPIAVAWASGRIRWGAALAWIASTGFGILAGKGPKTGSPLSKRWLDRFLPMTAYAFVLGLLIALAFGIHWVLGKATIANADARIRIAELMVPPAMQNAAEVQEMAVSSLISEADRAKQASSSAVASLEAFFSKKSIAPIQLGAFQAAPVTMAASVPSRPSEPASKFQSSWNLLNASLYGLWPFPWHSLRIWPLFLWTVILFGLAVGLSRCVNINEFSMHRFYRNRLVRCYLGASRANERRPNPFTGFDPADDLQLMDLQARKGYGGPFPLINTTLNLVKGKDLAWQERKAESFVLSPLHCGFDVWLERRDEASPSDTKLDKIGYRPTDTYAYPHGGFYLGTAMGISGAAVSPNMGYHSSPALAFLMTMFNVRLGFWAGNPRRSDTWEMAGPKVGLFRLLAELFGATNDTSRYVYLSDGGHFENLGLYELVKRRCKFILACDASADPNYDFGDLANAIRKCRSDLGVDIEISTKWIEKNPQTGFSKMHVAVGQIRYDQADSGAVPGHLIYVKASLTGNEPPDVLNYRLAHREFPHQTTADQFFSESQFESYRMLGQHAVAELFKPLLDEKAKPDKVVGAAEKWRAYREERTYVAVLDELVKSNEKAAEALQNQGAS